GAFPGWRTFAVPPLAANHSGARAGHDARSEAGRVLLLLPGLDQRTQVARVVGAGRPPSRGAARGGDAPGRPREVDGSLRTRRGGRRRTLGGVAARRGGP